MALPPVRARCTRIGPRHARLGRAAFRCMLPLLECYYARHRTYRLNSAFAAERLRAVRAELDRGATVYLAGISPGGPHNSGVALVEASSKGGIRLICNHEEERFSGIKHSTEYPRNALDALVGTIDRLGIGLDRIAAWLGTWDYAAFGSTLIRILFEELPNRLVCCASTRFLHLICATVSRRLGPPIRLASSLVAVDRCPSSERPITKITR